MEETKVTAQLNEICDALGYAAEIMSKFDAKDLPLTRVGGKYLRTVTQLQEITQHVSEIGSVLFAEGSVTPPSMSQAVQYLGEACVDLYGACSYLTTDENMLPIQFGAGA